MLSILLSDSKVLQFSDFKQAVDEDIEKATFAYKAVILTSEFWVASSEQTQGVTFRVVSREPGTWHRVCSKLVGVAWGL